MESTNPIIETDVVKRHEKKSFKLFLVVLFVGLALIPLALSFIHSERQKLDQQFMQDLARLTEQRKKELNFLNVKYDDFLKQVKSGNEYHFGSMKLLGEFAYKVDQSEAKAGQFVDAYAAYLDSHEDYQNPSAAKAKTIQLRDDLNSIYKEEKQAYQDLLVKVSNYHAPNPYDENIAKKLVLKIHEQQGVTDELYKKIFKMYEVRAELYDLLGKNLDKFKYNSETNHIEIQDDQLITEYDLKVDELTAAGKAVEETLNKVVTKLNNDFKTLADYND